MFQSGCLHKKSFVRQEEFLALKSPVTKKETVLWLTISETSSGENEKS